MKCVTFAHERIFFAVTAACDMGVAVAQRKLQERFLWCRGARLGGAARFNQAAAEQGRCPPQTPASRPAPAPIRAPQPAPRRWGAAPRAARAGAALHPFLLSTGGASPVVHHQRLTQALRPSGRRPPAAAAAEVVATWGGVGGGAPSPPPLGTP